MFRKLHRWFSLPLCLFIVLVLATGVALQVEETLGTLGGAAERSVPSSPGALPEPLSDAAIQAMVGSALAQSRSAQPDFQPRRIEIDLIPGRESTRLALQPRGGPFVTVDHATGETLAVMQPSVPLHVWLIRLHTGSLAGPFGIWIMLFTSFALMFLAGSGLVLYYQMWVHRKKRGRGKLFWH